MATVFVEYRFLYFNIAKNQKTLNRTLKNFHVRKGYGYVKTNVRYYKAIVLCRATLFPRNVSILNGSHCCFLALCTRQTVRDNTKNAFNTVGSIYCHCPQVILGCTLTDP